jgi:two-component system, cell cycle sensor histidine kinase and response regulator CckA
VYEAAPSEYSFERPGADLPESQKTITVLLVEDETMLRDLLGKVLRQAGYRVIMAEDGHHALQVAGQHHGKIDLLLSDVQMPRMTGPEVARLLRRERPDLHVVLISAFPPDLIVLEPGWAFLQKPFRPDAIIERIRGVLSAPRTRDGHQG